MSRACRAITAGVLIATLCSPRALADGPETWFAEALHHDIDGKEPASVAFALYIRAAEAGFPEAEFNVGVMLDSGRGVERDLASAATWYARAAAHDNRRAAYNLAQLYEAGEGVPKNKEVARVWFAASDLAAARFHLRSIGTDARQPASLTAPDLVFPNGRTKLGAGMRMMEFVWTAWPQPEPTEFFIEMRQLERSGSREVFSGFTRKTSISAELPALSGSYAWRVLTLARRAGLYAMSGWSRFTVESMDRDASAPPPDGGASSDGPRLSDSGTLLGSGPLRN